MVKNTPCPAPPEPDTESLSPAHEEAPPDAALDTPDAAEPPGCVAEPAPSIDSAEDGAPKTAEIEGQQRWHAHWAGFLAMLSLALVAGAAYWVGWRQSVAHQPPLEVSALSAPQPEARAAPPASSAPTATAAPQKIRVHIVGLVKRPGVLELQGGARLQDALQGVGGPRPGADLEAINLAEPLRDGQQYRVPERQAARPATAPRRVQPQVLAAPQSIRKSELSQPQREAPRATSAKASSAPVDINRAGVDELQNLPGVGPATAAKIIEYRDEVGGFKSVDDLDGVKGIGPKKLEKMRPFALVR